MLPAAKPLLMKPHTGVLRLFGQQGGKQRSGIGLSFGKMVIGRSVSVQEMAAESALMQRLPQRQGF